MPSLAEQLRRAFDKLESGIPPSVAEVRVLRAIREAASDAKLGPIARSTVPPLAAAVAAAVVGSVVRVIVTLSLPVPGPHSAALSLAMQPVDGVRSAAHWTPGDQFVIEAQLSADRCLYVLQLDADGELEFLFPFYDAASSSWDCLGHPDNHVPGGAPLAIPAASSPLHLEIDATKRGDEFFIAFATVECVDEDRLLEVRRKLRIAVQSAGRAGAAPEVLAGRVEGLIARELTGVQARLRYRVEPAASVDDVRK